MNASTLFLLTILPGMLSASEVPYHPPNQFTVETWNVESAKPDPHLAALRIAQTRGVQLWGLVGVRNQEWAEMFRAAAGENQRQQMTGILSPTRGPDRLQILYDQGTFDLVRYYELGWSDEPWYRADMVLRPALVAQLRHLATGQEFLFMVNSLNPRWTALQADKLLRWARGQSLPTIAVGTYYFQYNLSDKLLRCDGQTGLSILLTSGVFQWIKPQDLVTTYNSPYDTIEDFIFTAHAAGVLEGRSQIVVGPGDFSGSKPTWAHRPVRATFTILAVSPEASLRQRIKEQAEKVQEDMAKLKELLDQLPE